MEKFVRAFFYEYKYYLFPDGVALSDLKKMQTVTVRRLKEDRCMAPDFIYESMEEETLAIEYPERLFEVLVNLYTSKEYDEILLRQVNRVCPGCVRYTKEDEPGLEGHHREISLSGVCYERFGEDEYWDFAMCVEAFWDNVSEKLNELAEYIDQGDQKKLNDVLKKILDNFFIPLDFYGGVYEGKYCLCCAPDFDHMPVVRLICTYFAEVAKSENSPMKKADWVVFPYRKQGVFRYTGKSKFDSLSVRLDRARSHGGYCMKIYNVKPLDEKKKQTFITDLYNYLFEMLGEQVVVPVVTEFGFTAENEGMFTVPELLRKIEEEYAESFGDNESYPAPVTYSPNAAYASKFPYRGKITEGITNCPNISFLESLSDNGTWWLEFLGFFYLYVPRPADDALEVVNWYLSNQHLVPEPLRDPDSATITGGNAGVAFCGEDGFIIDCFAASEKSFYRNMRIIAPVLEAYGAKLVAVSKERVAVYECGYEFTPVEGDIYDE